MSAGGRRSPARTWPGAPASSWGVPCTLGGCSVTRMPCPAWPPGPRPCPGHRCTARSPRSRGCRRSGGFAMLPDLDQKGSTVSRMWGPVTDLPSAAVNAISGGHRWGTHDVSSGPLAFGVLAYAAAWHRWSSLLLLALAIGLALRALHVVIPGRAEETIIGNLVLSWGGAWLLLAHSPEPGVAAAGRRRRRDHAHRRRWADQGGRAGPGVLVGPAQPDRPGAPAHRGAGGTDGARAGSSSSPRRCSCTPTPAPGTSSSRCSPSSADAPQGGRMTGPVYVSRLLTDDAMAALAALGVPLVVGREEPPTPRSCAATSRCGRRSSAR